MPTAHRPQTDGLSERFNESMQHLLRCYVCETDDQWVDALPMIEFCFDNAVNESLRISPFEANYAFKPLTPLDVALILRLPCRQMPKSELSYSRTHMHMQASFLA